MRRLTVVLVLVSLPLAAAACGGSSKPKAAAPNATAGASAMNVVKSAAAKTALAGSEHVALTVGGTDAGQKLAVTGSGDFDNKHHIGSLHVDFAAGGINASMDTVLSTTSMYLKSPLFSTLLPSGKSWLKLDLKKTAAAQGLNLNTLLSQDPTQTLDALQSLTGATKVGSAQVGGVSTTHYRARIDVSKLPGAAAKGARGGTYDVWIGDDGYVYRVRTKITTASGSQKAVVTLTTDLSDFGQKVSVAVPAASQTMTSTGSLPGLGG